MWYVSLCSVFSCTITFTNAHYIITSISLRDGDYFDFFLNKKKRFFILLIFLLLFHQIINCNGINDWYDNSIYFLLLFLNQVSFQMLDKICFTHFHLLLFTNGLHYPFPLANSNEIIEINKEYNNILYNTIIIIQVRK